MDSRDDDLTVLIDERFGFVRRLGTALDGQPKCFSRVVHPESDVLDAVAVLVDVGGDLAVWPQRSRQNEADLSLLQDVARAIARSRFGTSIGEDFIAEHSPVEVCGLLRVTDIELDEVRSVDRKGVGELIRCRKCRGAHDFSGFRLDDL
jgi:hypothetical protein